jgi:hypothetical protein
MMMMIMVLNDGVIILVKGLINCSKRDIGKRISLQCVFYFIIMIFNMDKRRLVSKNLCYSFFFPTLNSFIRFHIYNILISKERGRGE